MERILITNYQNTIQIIKLDDLFDFFIAKLTSVDSPIRISQHSKLIGYCFENKIRITELDELKNNFELDNQSVASILQFSEDNNLFVNFSKDNFIKIWNIRQQLMIGKFSFLAQIREIYFNQSNKLVIYFRSTIAILDIQNIENIKIFDFLFWQNKQSEKTIEKLIKTQNNIFQVKKIKNLIFLRKLKYKQLSNYLFELPSQYQSIKYSEKHFFAVQGFQNQLEIWNDQQQILYHTFSNVSTFVFTQKQQLLLVEKIENPNIENSHNIIKLIDFKVDQKACTVLEIVNCQLFDSQSYNIVQFSIQNILVLANNRSMQIYKLQDSQLTYIAKMYINQINFVKLLSNNSYICLNYNNNVKFIHLTKIEQQNQLLGRQGQYLTKSMTLNQNENYLILLQGTRVIVWNLQTLNIEKVSIDLQENSVALFLANDQFVFSQNHSSQSHVNFCSIEQLNMNPQKIISGLSVINTFSFFVNNDLLALNSHSKLLIWDIKRKQFIASFSGHSEAIQSISFFPFGQIIASGSEDKLIRLWNVTSLQNKTSKECHNNCITALKFSPDGLILASASEDGQIRLWSMQNKRCISFLNCHSKEVYNIEFSEDQRFFLSNDVNNIILWNITNHKAITHQFLVKDIEMQIFQVIFTKKSNVLSYHKLQKKRKQYFFLWSLQDCLNRCEAEIELSFSNKIDQYQFLQTPNFIAYLSYGQIGIINFQTKNNVKIIESQSPIQYFDFSDNEKKLATIDIEFILIIWENKNKMQWLKLKQFFLKYQLNQNEIYFKFAREELIFHTKTHVSYLKLQEQENTQNHWIIGNQINEVNLVFVDKNLNIIVINHHIQLEGSFTVRSQLSVYNLENFQLLKTLKGPNQDITSISLSFDGKYLSAAYYGNIYVWDYQTETLASEPFQAYSGENSVQFLNNSIQILIVYINEGNKIIKWDFQTNKHNYFQIADENFSLIKISPLGNFIAGTIDSNKELQIFELKKDDELFLFKFKIISDSIIELTFNYDGNYLIFYDYNESISLLNVGKQEIVFQFKQQLIIQRQTRNKVLSFSLDEKSVIFLDHKNFLQLELDEKMKVLQANHFCFQNLRQCLAINKNQFLILQDKQLNQINKALRNILSSASQYYQKMAKIFTLKKQNKIKIYDKTQKIEEIDCHSERTIYLSPNEELFVFTQDQYFCLIEFNDIQNHSKSLQFNASYDKSDTIKSIVISQNNSFLTTKSEEYFIKLWNISNKINPKLMCTFFGQEHNYLQFSFDSQFFSRHYGKQINIIKNEICQEVKIQIHQSYDQSQRVLGLKCQEAIDNKENILIVTEKKILLTDIHSDTLYEIFKFKEYIEHFAFGNFKNLLAFTEKIGTIQIIEFTDQKYSLVQIDAQTENVNSLQFSQSDKLLLTGDSSYAIKIWCMEKFVLLAQLNLGDSVQSVAFSPDGSLLASGTYDGNVYLCVSNISQIDVKKKNHKLVKCLGTEYQIGCIKVFAKETLLQKSKCSVENMQIISDDRTLAAIFDQKQ